MRCSTTILMALTIFAIGTTTCIANKDEPKTSSKITTDAKATSQLKGQEDKKAELQKQHEAEVRKDVEDQKSFKENEKNSYIDAEN